MDIKTVLIHRYDTSNEWALKQALLNIGLRKDARRIFSMWPILEKSSLRLASYLSNLYPCDNPNRSLLEHILLDSISAYQRSCRAGEDERAQNKAFLLPLAEWITGVRNYRVTGKTQHMESHRWDHFSVPMTEWIRKNRIVQISFEKVSPVTGITDAVLRDFLLAKILSLREIALVHEALSEKNMEVGDFVINSA